MIVRRARPDDVPAVAKIHVDAWRSAYRGLLSDAVLEALSYEARRNLWYGVLADRSETMHLFVAEAGGAIAGLACCGRNRDATPGAAPGELSAIYVTEASLGRGVGHALFEAVRGDLEGRALVPFVLWVLAENARAIAFYERHGGRRFADKEATIHGEPARELGYRFENAG